MTTVGRKSRAASVAPQWERATQAQLEAYKRRYDTTYEAGKPLVSDPVYDAMVRILRARFPQSKALRDVGAATHVHGRQAEKMPIVVGSLNLLRPKDVAGWMREIELSGRQERWLVEPKFDGAS